MRRHFASALVALPILLTVGACSLIPATRSAVNEALCNIGLQGDPATLALTATGFVFDPVEGEAQNFVAYGGGIGLTSTEPRSSVQGNGVAFFEDGGIDVAEPLAVNFEGADRSVSVSFNRPGVIEPRFCRVRE